MREEVTCGVPAGVNASRCTLNTLDLPLGVGFKDYWDVNEAISVVEEGTIWVRVFDDVKKEDDVFYLTVGADITPNTTDINLTKYFGMCGSTGTQLPNAKFDSSALAGECALVRINR